jgi:nitrate/TMAO reductase-like tetraheme cytochrome c subunit
MKGYERTPEHRARMSAALPSGKDHHAWKGDKASYVSIHEWVRRKKQKTGICRKCKNKMNSTGTTEWANKDHKYRRILEDWIELCPFCHHQYDHFHFGDEVYAAETR